MAEAAQNSLHRHELVAHGHHLFLTDVLLEALDLGAKVELVHERAVHGILVHLVFHALDRVLLEEGGEVLGLLQKRNQRRICDFEVGDSVQQLGAAGEAADNLLEAAEGRVNGLVRAHVPGGVHAQAAHRGDLRKRELDHLGHRLELLAHSRGKNGEGLAHFLHRGGRVAGHHHIHALGRVRVLLATPALNACDDSPAPAAVELDEASGLEELCYSVRGQDLAANLVVDPSELVLEVVIARELVLVLHHHLVVLLLHGGQLLLEPRDRALLLEHEERVPDDELWVGILDAHKVQKHVVAEIEGRGERVGLAAHDFLGLGRLHLLVHHLDDNTALVQSTAAGAPTHLNVLAGSDPTEIEAVILSHGGKHHRFRRHVDAHGECLGGKEHLDEALAEQDLGDLLEDWQQAAVVDPDALLQQR
mmetsp:Transcript_22013/g.70286  ORF Transcript_22013/g.70286 Transcript_22013/m.70286 type:complete len:419 (+) Transcript_22013:599-1855(+)